MKKVNIAFLVVTLFTFGIFLGFSNLSDKTKDKGPNDSKSGNTNTEVTKISDLNNKTQFDATGTPNQTFGVPYYTDNFDGTNDTASLKARGYLVYRNGTFSGTPSTDFWFTGNISVFPPQAGAGYVGSNYQTAGDAGDIDNWLVLPKKNIAVGDTLFFWSRSPSGSTFPDSIRVLYSASGDSTPTGSWTEISRFKTNTAAWEKRGFAAPSAGANARYAIRYSVVDGGLFGANSDYIGIDQLTIESPPIAADVGVESITDPVGSVVLPAGSILPTAVVKNFGTTAQSFNVTMTINPGGYSSTQSVSSLAGSATQSVDFSSYTPLAGTYTVRVYTQLATDGNRVNDTLQTTYSAYNPNYGGLGAFNTSSYFYSNSTAGATGAPSQPAYCRLDTAGSTSLVVNSVASIPLTLGGLDDGHWGILLGTPRKIKFMGVTYDSIYIGTNGLLGFINFTPGSSNWDPPANGLPSAGNGGNIRPALYALWNDMNWGNLSQPINRLSYKIDNTKNQLIVTYDRAPLFGGTAADFVTFQVCIELQADTTGAPNSRIVMGYDNNSTAVNLPILTGIQDATGTQWLQYAFVGNIVTEGPLFDTVGAGVAVAFGPDASNLDGHCKELNLTSYFEGFWNGGIYLGDTITVDIRSSVSPYPVIESHKVVNDASGYVAIDVGIANGTNYYITVNHRNTVRTWSQLVQWTGPKLTYDFTTAQTMAFGNNMILKSGKWCIYSGDINKDGVIDGSDGSQLDNDAANFVSGSYEISDLNWDTVVDGSDGTYVDNNAANFIAEIAP